MLRIISSLEYDVYPESEGHVSGYLEARIIWILSSGNCKFIILAGIGRETDALNIFRWFLSIPASNRKKDPDYVQYIVNKFL